MVKACFSSACSPRTVIKTVDELREVLKNLPGDLPIYLSSDNGCTVNVIYDDIGHYLEINGEPKYAFWDEKFYEY
jgi:hypothetical protein